MKETIWSDEKEPGNRWRKNDQNPEKFFLADHFDPEKEKAEKVLNYFSSVARRYDLMNTLLSFGIHHLWKRAAVKTIALKPGSRVIDVCGGTGDLAVLAAQAIRSAGQVVVYDISQAMMSAGKNRKRIIAFGKRIAFVLGDAKNVSFQDNTFDAAMVGFGIRNVDHMEKGFAEMHRVLKPGGKFMCLEFSKPTNLFFRYLYDIYSFYLIPFLGGVFTGSRNAYIHLPESIRRFPLPDTISALLADIGFSQVSYRKLTNGIAVIHTGVK